MNQLASITLPEYCERISDSFLGEPINLFTNLLFILSGTIIWLYVDKVSVRHKTYLKTLAVLVGLIGLGSFIFHGVPNEFTILLDAIPIYIFISLSLILVLYELTNSWRYAAIVVGVFTGILIAATTLVPSHYFNGSIRHILILTMITFLLALVYKKYSSVANYLIPVVGIYALAIVARSVDQYVCTVVTIGTHFMWHVLNALASFLVIIFLVKLIQQNAQKF